MNILKIWEPLSCEWALSFDSWRCCFVHWRQRQKVLRVFTYCSPPIFEIFSTSYVKETEPGDFSCSILDTLDLPTDIVYSCNQPWDPIVHLFSQPPHWWSWWVLTSGAIDEISIFLIWGIGQWLFYLLTGEDGYKPWLSGPSRTLRPILKTLLESWEGWWAFHSTIYLLVGQILSTLWCPHQRRT